MAENVAVPCDPENSSKTLRNFELFNESAAIQMTALKIDFNKNVNGKKVLILRERFDSSNPDEEFHEFDIGTILCVLEKGEVWVKPKGMHAFATSMDKICSVPQSYNCSVWIA